MKHSFRYCLFLISIASFSFSQNLILNSSYELYDYCKCIDGTFSASSPTNLNPKLKNIRFISGINGFSSPQNNIGFYSLLATNSFISGTTCTTLYGAPATQFGNRLPHTGNNFALMAWSPPGVNNNHYFKLSAPLIIGNYYTIEFWLACGTNTLPLRNKETVPQVTVSSFENGNFNFSKLNNYTNWVKISSCLRATTNTDSISLYGNIFGFIDDVSLYPAQRLQIAVSDTIGCGACLNAQFTPTNLGVFNKFDWFFGDNTIGNNSSVFTHSYSLPNTYNTLLIAQDTLLSIFGCYTQKFTGGNPIANFNNGIVVASIAATFTNTSQYSNTYQWFENSVFKDNKVNLTTTANNTEFTTICLEATDNLGCKDTMCKTIEVLLCDQLSDANVFTPNNDGINDLFYFFKSEPCNLSETKIFIFDRWGEEVYRYPDKFLTDESNIIDTTILYKNSTQNYKFIYTYKFWNGAISNLHSRFDILNNDTYFLIIETPTVKRSRFITLLK